MKASMVVLAGMIAIMSGCVSSRKTDTARTGVEQLVLSTAVDRAASKFDFSVLDGKTVYVDAENLETVDRGYVLGRVRQQLLEAGAKLADEMAKDGSVDVVVELISGSLGTDGSEAMFGIPSIGMQAMGTGMQTPEIAFFKSVTQQAEAKLVAHGRSAQNGEIVFSTGRKSADAYYNRYSVLFVHFSLTDVPEKEWWPQRKDEEGASD